MKKKFFFSIKDESQVLLSKKSRSGHSHFFVFNELDQGAFLTIWRLEFFRAWDSSSIICDSLLKGYSCSSWLRKRKERVKTVLFSNGTLFLIFLKNKTPRKTCCSFFVNVYKEISKSLSGLSELRRSTPTAGFHIDEIKINNAEYENFPLRCLVG